MIVKMNQFLYSFQSLPKPCFVGMRCSDRVGGDGLPCEKGNRYRTEEPPLCLDFSESSGTVTPDAKLRKRTIRRKNKISDSNEQFVKENDETNDAIHLTFSTSILQNQLYYAGGTNEISHFSDKICSRRSPSCGRTANQTRNAKVFLNELFITKGARTKGRSENMKDKSLNANQHPLEHSGHKNTDSNTDASLFASFLQQKEEEENALRLYKEFLEKHAYEEDNSVLSEDSEWRAEDPPTGDSSTIVPKMPFQPEGMLNFSNPSELAEILSPPTTLTGWLPKKILEVEKCLPVRFDADFGKYFDPSTGKYYELE